MNTEGLTVAGRLRVARLKSNKSRATVVSEIGISLSTLAMYENGKRIPRDDIKVKLAACYGITVMDLFY